MWPAFPSSHLVNSTHTCERFFELWPKVSDSLSGNGAVLAVNPIAQGPPVDASASCRHAPGDAIPNRSDGQKATRLVSISIAPGCATQFLCRQIYARLLQQPGDAAKERLCACKRFFDPSPALLIAFLKPSSQRRVAHAQTFHGGFCSLQRLSSIFLSRSVSIACQKP
jgi:hypothetical protein